MSLFEIFKKINKSLPKKWVRKIPGAFAIRRNIYNILKPRGMVKFDYDGLKINISGKDMGVGRSLMMNDVYEEYETKIFKEKLKPEMVVIDVGANFGYYSLIASRIVGEKGKIYAFEPEPFNYNLLVRNINENGLKNIVPIKKAVSNKKGKIKLFIDKKNLGNHSFVSENIIDKSGHIEVETISLDDFVKKELKNRKIGIIKIDVQGAEGLVIEGSKDLLKKQKAKLFIEFWPKGLKKGGYVPSKLIEKIIESGYKAKAIEGFRKKLNKLSNKEILEMSKSASEFNLFFEK